MAGNAHCHSRGGKPLVPMLSALKGSSANQQLDSQWTKDMNRKFIGEMLMGSKYMKKCLFSVLIEK